MVDKDKSRSQIFQEVGALIKQHKYKRAAVKLEALQGLTTEQGVARAQLATGLRESAGRDTALSPRVALKRMQKLRADSKDQPAMQRARARQAANRPSHAPPGAGFDRNAELLKLVREQVQLIKRGNVQSAAQVRTLRDMFRRQIDMAMNDSATPGVITDAEWRLITRKIKGK